MPRVQGGKTSRKVMAHVLHTSNPDLVNIDLVQSVIENLLVISALLLGFVISMCLQCVNTKDLIRADEEYMRGERLAGDPNFFGFVTVDYFMHGNTTMLIFFIILWSGILLDVSFRFSYPRGDPEVFARWWNIGKYGIGLCYCLIVIGIYFFCQTVHDWQMITFPRYPDLAVENESLYIPDQVSRITEKKGALHWDSDRAENLLFYSMSRVFELGIYTFFAVCGTGVFFIHYLWVVYNCLRKEGPDEYADQIDAQAADAEGRAKFGPKLIQAYKNGEISARAFAKRVR